MSEKVGGHSVREVLTGRASTAAPPNDGGLNIKDMTQVIPRTSAIQAPHGVVATIATQALHQKLEEYYLAVPLYPDSLVDTVNAVRPKFFVIDRSALSCGPWFGVEHEAGGTLIDELMRLEKWSRKHDSTVILVDSFIEDGYYTPRLREMAHRIFPSEAFWSELPERPRRRAIYHLVHEYGSQQKCAEGNENLGK